MAWIAIIIQLLQVLPDIIGLIMKIFNIIEGIPNVQRRREARKELRAAIRLARRTRDPKHIEAVYEKYKNG